MWSKRLVKTDKQVAWETIHDLAKNLEQNGEKLFES